MEAPASFAARRPAATALPAFSLPPPDVPSMQRHPASASHTMKSSSQPQTNPHYLPSSTASQPIPPVPPASNVLTPPPGVASEGLSPLSSGVNSGSSQSSQPSGGGPYYQQLTGQWPTPGNPSSSYTFGNTANQSVQPYGGGRALYSPGVQQFAGRSTSSPAGGEGLPPPPYSHEVPSFQGHVSGGGGGSGSSNLPSHPQPPILSSQTLPSQQPHTPSSGPPTTESYRTQPPTSTAFYASSSAAHQSPFQGYAPNHPSPSQPSPTTSAAMSRGIASVASQSGSMAAPNIGYGGPRPPSTQAYGFQIPNAGSGPVLSNLGTPGGQMALVPGMGMSMGPGFNPGHHHSQMSHHLFDHGHSHGHGGHGSQGRQQSDRPFKCDQCPQSFNRNHDLKRHKRIHLAVKPFPCNHCDKSFSRKDALKVSAPVFSRFFSPTDELPSQGGWWKREGVVGGVFLFSADGKPWALTRPLHPSALC